MVRLVKPAWVSHDGGGIYTMDVQPNGLRMATGGMCSSGGIICIWNMLPIRHIGSEKDVTVPKKLCQMDNHISCVNCVRFSPNGKWLASSGDDAVIMIWYLVKRGAPTTVFGSKTEFAESWRIHSQLKGHHGDILHLSWSPHSSWLASASIDNTVMVWNVTRHPPQQMTVLRGHLSMVKGITWDPSGRYLASQSDDRSVRIWRTSDWKEEAKLKEPFKKSAGTTHVLRLDWSPDGSTVVAPHAINSGFPTAQIIFRQGWKPSLDFVGHRQAITCVRFNSNVFSKKFSENSKPQNVLCVALGCKDRSLSVWMTPRRRPLVVLHDLFAGSIMDLTWSQCGMELLCCSLDGSVAFLQFSEREMGIPLSRTELVKLHRDTYGQSLLCAEDAAAINIGGFPGGEMKTGGEEKDKGTLAESAEMLALQREQRKKEEEKAKESEGSREKEEILPRGPSEQIETRNQGGVRRITPKFLGHLHGEAEEEEVVPTGSVESPPPPPPAPVPSPPPPSTPTPALPPPATPTTPIGVPETPEGRRRRGPGRPRKEQLMEKEVQSTKAKILSSSSGESSENEAESTQSGASSSTEEAEEIKKKRGRPKKRVIASSEDEEKKLEEDKKKKQKAKKKKGKRREEGITSKKEERAKLLLVGATGLPTSQSSLGLGGDRSVQVDSVEVRSRSGAPTRLHRLSVWDARLNQRTSEVLLYHRPVALATTKEHVCLCDERGRLHIWNASCTRLCPPLRMEAGCVSMTTVGNRLLLVTTDCVAHLWSLSPSIRLLHRTSFASLVPSPSAFRSCQLNADDTVVISLADGSAFAFSTQAKAWMELNDNTDPVRQLSRVLYKDGHPSGPLTLATTGSRSGFFVAASPAGSESNVREAALEDFLESQLASARLLRSPDEARFWLLAYARHIIAAGREEKVRRLCDDLLGPTHPDAAAHSSWEDNILGVRKRGLLQEILPSFGLNLKLQRLYMEVKEQVDMID